MNPNDLGEFSTLATVAENLVKLKITDVLKTVKSKMRRCLVQSELEVSGIKVRLQTSKTGFGGERLWFTCPDCGRRVGTLYRSESGGLGCQKCLRLTYRKQRYKGMTESGGGEVVK